MNRCKYCGECSPNILDDVCVECLADKMGEVVELIPKFSREAIKSDIEFIDLRNQNTGFNFALFNKKTDRFITVYGKSAWACFFDLAMDLRFEVEDLCQDPRESIGFYAKQCPDWVII